MYGCGRSNKKRLVSPLLHNFIVEYVSRTKMAFRGIQSKAGKDLE